MKLKKDDQTAIRFNKRVREIIEAKGETIQSFFDMALVRTGIMEQVYKEYLDERKRHTTKATGS